jgi:hypothetical protein
MSKHHKSQKTMPGNEEWMARNIVRSQPSVFAAKPDPIEVLREMKARQHATMTLIARDEAKVHTGYEKVSMAALREDASIHLLMDMMEFCRPGGGKDEEDFIDTYIKPFNPTEDNYGNNIIVVPATDEDYPRILWSCHTDTVHRQGGRQSVVFTDGIAWTSDGSCLGSDDTVGVWMAIEMIKAKVPGTYVFHRDEESGGGGSAWLAKNAEAFLGQHACAIALDRAGYRDVITHQAGGRCCSDAFAKTLASLMDGEFKPCDGGVFTDTANYTDAIGECTNLSVGYFRQHGPMEHTNLGFASRMRDALIAADWTKLVFERKPGEEDEAWGWGGRYDDKWGTYAPRKPYKPGKPYGETHEDKIADLEEYIDRYPYVVAEYLLAHGVTIDDLDNFEPEIEDEVEGLDEDEDIEDER